MDAQRELTLRQAVEIGGGVVDSDALLSDTPPWSHTSSQAQSFFGAFGDSPLERLSLFKKNIPESQARVEEVLSSSHFPCVRYLLILFYEGLRVDSTLYDVLVGVKGVYLTLVNFLKRTNIEAADADRAAYVLSGIMSHAPSRFFSGDEAVNFAKTLSTTRATQVGTLAALANLLKGDEYRLDLWKNTKMVELVFGVAVNAAAPLLYKSLLCVWLWSFNADVAKELASKGLIPRLNSVLSSSRVEKIVRIALQILKNTLSDSQICEDVAENGSLEIVNQLEYEKWRDAELYEDIKSCSAKIAQEISVLSNFDRYERELQTGKLSWGFIHTERFWVENVSKFEKDDFRAIKALMQLIGPKSSPETLAVTCHDLGEFARLHPVGKRVCDRFAVKGRVLELMLDKDREVAREALLCVQKLMLQKNATLEN